MLSKETKIEETIINTIVKSDQKITSIDEKISYNSTEYNIEQENKLGVSSKQLQTINKEFVTSDPLVINDGFFQFQHITNKQDKDSSLEINIWTAHEAPLPVFMWKIKKPHIMTIYSPTQFMIGLKATFEMVEEMNKIVSEQESRSTFFGPYVIALNSSDCQYYFDRIVNDIEGYNHLYSGLYKTNKCYALNNPYKCHNTQFHPFLTRDDLLDTEYCCLLQKNFNTYCINRVNDYFEMFGCLKAKEVIEEESLNYKDKETNDCKN